MKGVTCSRSCGVDGELARLVQHLDAHRFDRGADRQAFLDGVVGAGVEQAQQPGRTVEVDERVVGGGADDVGAGPAVEGHDEAAEHVVDGPADHGDAGGVGFGDHGFVFRTGRRRDQDLADPGRQQALDALRQQRPIAERRQHLAGQAARIPCGPGG